MSDKSLTMPDGWSPERGRLLKALEEGTYSSVTELCATAGVSRETYYQAVKNEEFVKALFASSTGAIYASIPQIMAKIVDQAKKGSFAHQKLLLEMLKLYQGGPDNQTNIQINVQPIFGGQSVSADDRD